MSAYKTNIAFVISCHIIGLCNQSKVPIISRVDNKAKAVMREDIEKTKMIPC